jgi:hypothetical protein
VAFQRRAFTPSYRMRSVVITVTTDTQKAKNRAAAERSRLKKKAEIKALVEEVEALRAENVRLANVVLEITKIWLSVH